MTDIETLIIEAADRQDLTYAKDFNGRAYALMDANWIEYFDTLDEVIKFLDIPLGINKGRKKEYRMTIYVDNGKSVKIYPVKSKVARAVMTLLETDDELAYSETDKGYSVAIIDKTERKDD